MTNIYQSFTYKVAAKIYWHRHRTKLRHCLTVYTDWQKSWWVSSFSRLILQLSDESRRYYAALFAWFYTSVRFSRTPTCDTQTDGHIHITNARKLTNRVKLPCPTHWLLARPDLTQKNCWPIDPCRDPEGSRFLHRTEFLRQTTGWLKKLYIFQRTMSLEPFKIKWKRFLQNVPRVCGNKD